MVYRYNGSQPEPPGDPKAGIVLLRMSVFVVLILIATGWILNYRAIGTRLRWFPATTNPHLSRLVTDIEPPENIAQALDANGAITIVTAK